MIQTWIFLLKIGLKLLKHAKLSILPVDLEDPYLLVHKSKQLVCALKSTNVKVSYNYIES